MPDLEEPAGVAHGEAYAWLRSLPDRCADAVITDPPYSSGGAYRGDRTQRSTTEKYVQTGTIIDRPDFAGDNRDQRGYLAWCALWLAEALRVARPGAHLLMFTDWRQLPTTTDAVQAGGWLWRGVGVWHKAGGRPQRNGFALTTEFVVHGTAGAQDFDHVAYLPGIVSVTVRQADKHHITGKPTDLLRQLVRLAPPDGLVLDPFAGSGTTGVACALEGRRFAGVELAAEYVEVSRRRIAEAHDLNTTRLFDLEPITAAEPDALEAEPVP